MSNQVVELSADDGEQLLSYAIQVDDQDGQQSDSMPVQLVEGEQESDGGSLILQSGAIELNGERHVIVSQAQDPDSGELLVVLQGENGEHIALPSSALSGGLVQVTGEGGDQLIALVPPSSSEEQQMVMVTDTQGMTTLATSSAEMIERLVQSTSNTSLHAATTLASSIPMQMSHSAALTHVVQSVETPKMTTQEEFSITKVIDPSKDTVASLASDMEIGTLPTTNDNHTDSVDIEKLTAKDPLLESNDSTSEIRQEDNDDGDDVTMTIINKKEEGKTETTTILIDTSGEGKKQHLNAEKAIEDKIQSKSSICDTKQTNLEYGSAVIQVQDSGPQTSLEQLVANAMVGPDNDGNYVIMATTEDGQVAGLQTEINLADVIGSGGAAGQTFFLETADGLVACTAATGGEEGGIQIVSDSGGDNAAAIIQAAHNAGNLVEGQVIQAVSGGQTMSYALTSTSNGFELTPVGEPIATPKTVISQTLSQNRGTPPRGKPMPKPSRSPRPVVTGETLLLPVASKQPIQQITSSNLMQKKRSGGSRRIGSTSNPSTSLITITTSSTNSNVIQQTVKQPYTSQVSKPIVTKPTLTAASMLTSSLPGPSQLAASRRTYSKKNILWLTPEQTTTTAATTVTSPSKITVTSSASSTTTSTVSISTVPTVMKVTSPQITYPGSSVSNENKAKVSITSPSSTTTSSAHLSSPTRVTLPLIASPSITSTSVIEVVSSPVKPLSPTKTVSIGSSQKSANTPVIVTHQAEEHEDTGRRRKPIQTIKVILDENDTEFTLKDKFEQRQEKLLREKPDDKKEKAEQKKEKLEEKREKIEKQKIEDKKSESKKEKISKKEEKAEGKGKKSEDHKEKADEKKEPKKDKTDEKKDSLDEKKEKALQKKEKKDKSDSKKDQKSEVTSEKKGKADGKKEGPKEKAIEVEELGKTSKDTEELEKSEVSEKTRDKKNESESTPKLGEVVDKHSRRSARKKTAIEPSVDDATVQKLSELTKPDEQKDNVDHKEKVDEKLEPKKDKIDEKKDSVDEKEKKKDKGDNKKDQKAEVTSEKKGKASDKKEGPKEEKTSEVEESCKTNAEELAKIEVSDKTKDKKSENESTPKLGEVVDKQSRRSARKKTAFEPSLDDGSGQKLSELTKADEQKEKEKVDEKKEPKKDKTDEKKELVDEKKEKKDKSDNKKDQKGEVTSEKKGKASDKKEEPKEKTIEVEELGKTSKDAEELEKSEVIKANDKKNESESTPKLAEAVDKHSRRSARKKTAVEPSVDDGSVQKSSELTKTDEQKDSVEHKEKVDEKLEPKKDKTDEKKDSVDEKKKKDKSDNKKEQKSEVTSEKKGKADAPKEVAEQETSEVDELGKTRKDSEEREKNEVSDKTKEKKNESESTAKLGEAGDKHSRRSGRKKIALETNLDDVSGQKLPELTKSDEQKENVDHKEKVDEKQEPKKDKSDDKKDSVEEKEKKDKSDGKKEQKAEVTSEKKGKADGKKEEKANEGEELGRTRRSQKRRISLDTSDIESSLSESKKEKMEEKKTETKNPKKKVDFKLDETQKEPNEEMTPFKKKLQMRQATPLTTRRSRGGGTAATTTTTTTTTTITTPVARTPKSSTTSHQKMNSFSEKKRLSKTAIVQTYSPVTDERGEDMERRRTITSLPDLRSPAECYDYKTNECNFHIRHQSMSLTPFTPRGSGSSYTCQKCGYRTSRMNNLVLHHKDQCPVVQNAVMLHWESEIRKQTKRVEDSNGTPQDKTKAPRAKKRRLDKDAYESTDDLYLDDGDDDDQNDDQHVGDSHDDRPDDEESNLRMDTFADVIKPTTSSTVDMDALLMDSDDDDDDELLAIKTREEFDSQRSLAKGPSPELIVFANENVTGVFDPK